MLTRIMFMTMMVFAGTELSACAPNLTAAFVYCEVAKPISWSKNDTAQTVREVKEANAVFKSLCPK